MFSVIFLISIVGFTYSAPPLEPYNIEAGSLTLSGISAGAAFASQFHVAYSSLVTGMASFAGVPYYCAKGLLFTALYTCMPDSGVDVDELISKALEYEASEDIDPTSNLQGSKVFLWHGTRDSTVDPGNSVNMRTFYETFGSSIQTMLTMQAGHGQPTLDYGITCSLTGSPYINDCDYDGAFEALNYMYGGALNAPVPPTGQLFQYDQDEFDDSSFGTSWNEDGGYIYVPDICNSRAIPCKLHVAFHGCLQTRQDIDDEFALFTGYREVADANNIIVLFPQIKKDLISNPNGCFDWWGYDGSSYARKDGPQMLAVKAMIDRVMSGSTGTPPPSSPPTTLPPCREL